MSQPCPKDSGNRPARVSKEAAATELIPVSCLLSKETRSGGEITKNIGVGEKEAPAAQSIFLTLHSAQSPR